MNEEAEISYAFGERDADNNIVYSASSGPAVITVVDDENTLETDQSEFAFSWFEGSSFTFRVRLRYEPSTTAVISVTNAAGEFSSISPDSLTFTTENWDTYQTVSITVAENQVVEGDRDTVLLFTPDIDEVHERGWTFNIVDDDEAAARSPGTSETATPVFPPNITFENFPEELTVGQVAQFDFGLSSEPTSDITVAVTNSDSSVVFTNFASHTFSQSNWQSKARVNVLGWASASVGDTATLTFTASGDGYTDSSTERTITIVES